MSALGCKADMNLLHGTCLLSGVKRTSQFERSHAFARSYCRIDRRLVINLTRKHDASASYARVWHPTFSPLPDCVRLRMAVALSGRRAR